MSDAGSLSEGIRGQVTALVRPEDTAARLGSGEVDFLGTPRVLALLEQAACGAVKDRLAPGQTSVGTVVDLRHLRPSAIGERVCAEVVVSVWEGRRITFTGVLRAIPGGEEVATMTHVRVVVDRDTFGARPQ